MTVTQPDLFQQVRRHALQDYLRHLQEWLPGGKLVNGTEYVVLNPTRGDRKIKSFSINVKTGKWGDFATGDTGSDPIGLYAYVFCGGAERANRVEAARRMAVEFGIEPGEAPSRKAKVRPQLRVVKNEEPETWKPEVPPPDGKTYDREAGGWDHLYEYRDQSGRLLRYVGRRDAKGGTDKVVRPITYGVLDGKEGWFLKSPDAPRSLYGLERLDNAPVLLQEGEKKTDAVKLLLTEYACLSLTGGAGNRNCNDLEPLRGRHVIYCPDNDPDGRKTANAIAEKLAAMGCGVLVVDVFSHGFAAKWDLGDAVADGWDADRIRAFLKDNAHPFNPDPGAVDLDDEEPDGEDPAEWGGDRDGIIPLGFDGNVFYYLPKKGGQVVALTPNGHSELQLRSMASESYWEGMERFQKRDGGVNWKRVAGFFMRACQSLPIYTPDSLRGVGAWIDGERCVLHKGEHLIVDGKFHGSLTLPGKRSFVYERKASLNMTVAPPINAADANKLAEIVRAMPWENPLFGTLMAGWIAVAPICGALKWRPAVWVTGGSGAGKTTLDTNIVSPILDGICERMASSSTEAGIRQILKNNALPIIFDEAEAEGMTDKQRIQHVLDLVRASTQEGGAAIVKGTQSQTGAIRYTMRSCFMFMSVNVTINRQADESRITVLSLENSAKGDAMAAARYDRLMERIAATITPDYCAGFVARSVLLMGVIRDNAEVFKRAVAAKLGSARVGDQIGTLCAGAYSLHSSNRITLEEACAWVDRQNWEDATSADAATDEERLVDKLLSRSITVKSISTGTVDRTVGELLRAAAGQVTDFPAGPADEALRRCGIMFHRDGLEDGMYVANRHPALADYLKDTPWSSPASWRRALKRFPGAQSSVAPLYFAGVYSRAIFVPIRLPEPPI